MKSITIALAFILLSTLTFAQKMDNTIEQRISAIEDRMAIKYVGYSFTNSGCSNGYSTSQIND
jgi:hypothetical protein